jgi:hypothetical protein
MADLYRRLRAVGLTKPYVRKMILPDWWDDQVADNPAGYAEGLTFLSRHLGLDIATLRDPQRPVAFRNFGVCKFKKSKNATEDDLALARAMATRSAQLANVATAEPYQPVPPSASQIRREILGQGELWVSLSNLIDYCWSLGIPVIHLSSFPDAKHARRPDGLTARVNSRPVIVLCKKAHCSAWLLFILAHELGHIALGHIEGDGVLIDESMKHNVDDQEELAANAFAVELLTGNAEGRFSTSGRWPNAKVLAEAALQIGRQMRIDPGHIVLNYANTMGDRFYPVANAALALIEPKKDALRLVRQKMAEHLDWSSLPEDSSEFLMRVSQTERTSDLPIG